MQSLARYSLLAAWACLCWLPAASAQFIIDPYKVTPPAGGGPDTWYDVETSGNVDSSASIGSGSMAWATVTVGSAGNATKLRFYLGTSTAGTDSVKMALYSAGGSLLSSGTVATPNSNSAYVECTITTQAVTATTYNIAYISQSGNATIGYKTGTGTLNYQTETYASFPPPSLPSPSTIAYNMAISVYVD